jgi:hypothetical protein
MRARWMSVVFVLVAALALSSAASAQIYSPSTNGRRAPNAEKAAAAATPPAYDPHDLSGVWWGNNARTPTTGSILMGNPVPEMTPLGKQMLDANKPSQGPRGIAPGLGNDPLGSCDPLGYPRNLMQNSRAFEFIQVPGKIVQLFEWNFAVRQIFMDGRKIPDDVDPRWFGYAVGHWDGSTLVVDSAGYNDKTWLDGFGNPHSEDMTLQERWQHPDAMTLAVTMTLTDPKIYTKPWVSAKPMNFKLQLPKGVTEMEEAYCVPSEEEYFNEHVRNPAGGSAPKE